MNSGFSFLGVLIVVLLIIGAFVLLWPMVHEIQEAKARAACQENLKQWGTVLRMYAQEDPNGQLPSMMRRGSGIMDDEPCQQLPPPFHIDVAQLYPDYFNDPQMLSCGSAAGTFPAEKSTWPLGEPNAPFNPCLLIMSPSQEAHYSGDYTYFGWELDDNRILLADGSDSDSMRTPVSQGFIEVFAEGYYAPMLRQDAAAVDAFLAADLQFEHEANGSTTLPRLRLHGGGPEEGSDPNAAMPVMWDSMLTDGSEFSNVLMLNHMPGGSNVLYLDGHVEFLKYSGSVPVQASFIQFPYKALASASE